MDSKTERINRVKSRLKKYCDAEDKILLGQSYSIGSMSLTRANLPYVQSMIQKLENQLEALETSGSTNRKVKHIVPLG